MGRARGSRGARARAAALVCASSVHAGGGVRGSLSQGRVQAGGGVRAAAELTFQCLASNADARNGGLERAAVSGVVRLGSVWPTDGVQLLNALGGCSPVATAVMERLPVFVSCAAFADSMVSHVDAWRDVCSFLWNV